MALVICIAYAEIIVTSVECAIIDLSDDKFTMTLG